MRRRASKGLLNAGTVVRVGPGQACSLVMAVAMPYCMYCYRAIMAGVWWRKRCAPFIQAGLGSRDRRARDAGVEP